MRVRQKKVGFLSSIDVVTGGLEVAKGSMSSASTLN